MGKIILNKNELKSGFWFPLVKESFKRKMANMVDKSIFNFQGGQILVLTT